MDVSASSHAGFGQVASAEIVPFYRRVPRSQWNEAQHIAFGQACADYDREREKAIGTLPRLLFWLANGTGKATLGAALSQKSRIHEIILRREDGAHAIGASLADSDLEMTADGFWTLILYPMAVSLYGEVHKSPIDEEREFRESL